VTMTNFSVRSGTMISGFLRGMSAPINVTLYIHMSIIDY